MIRRDFQSRVAAWAVKCFGERIAVNKPTRNYRFIEEAVELVQSLGCSKEDVLKVVDYVFGRPPGDPHQEVGGVCITLYALAAANGLDVGTAGWDELARIDTPEVIEKIRAKQKLKINEEGVLPAQVAEAASGFHLNGSGEVAVADDYYTRTDMENCPRGVKVYLVGQGGVGTLANYDGDPWWVEWAALPKRRKG